MKLDIRVSQGTSVVTHHLAVTVAETVYYVRRDDKTGHDYRKVTYNLEGRRGPEFGDPAIEHITGVLDGVTTYREREYSGTELFGRYSRATHDNEVQSTAWSKKVEMKLLERLFHLEDEFQQRVFLSRV